MKNVVTTLEREMVLRENLNIGTWCTYYAVIVPLGGKLTVSYQFVGTRNNTVDP